MDGWNTSFLLGRPIFRGYVRFREGNLGSLQTAPDIARCLPVAGCSCWTGDKLFRRVWFDAIREAFPGAQNVLFWDWKVPRKQCLRGWIVVEGENQWSKDSFVCWWVLMVVVHVDFVIIKWEKIGVFRPSDNQWLIEVRKRIHKTGNPQSIRGIVGCTPTIPYQRTLGEIPI